MNASTSLSRRWRILDGLHQQVASRIERKLQREFGISTREYYALAALEGGATTTEYQVRAVARSIGLSSSATSRLLSRLHNRNFITLQVSERDRRTPDIQLTPMAHEVVRQGPGVLEKITSSVIGSLNPADHDPDLLRWLETDANALRPAPCTAP
ncbi:MarR family winged helix-turn-helix transcriptional regulator [Streptomyces fuscichromogenes]|nr:MarR family transcriptional regulator [Streptomyces fuscichromogenes]